MRVHDFQPDEGYDDACALCGEPADSPIHETDFDPREDERRDDRLTGDYPPTVAALFDSAGIRQP